MNRDEIIQAAKDEIAKDAQTVTQWKAEQWHAVVFVIIVVAAIAGLLYAAWRIV